MTTIEKDATPHLLILIIMSRVYIGSIHEAWLSGKPQQREHCPSGLALEKHRFAACAVLDLLFSVSRNDNLDSKTSVLASTKVSSAEIQKT